jgi:hypothetical protein
MDSGMRFGWPTDDLPSERPSGRRHVKTAIGALLVDLFEVVPNMLSVSVYRGGELQNDKGSPVDSQAVESAPEDGLLVTPALLGLANWQERTGPDGRDSLIVGHGDMYQLMLPVRGGHLSLAFELRAHPAAEMRRVVDVLNRHGLNTLWLVL